MAAGFADVAIGVRVVVVMMRVHLCRRFDGHRRMRVMVIVRVGMIIMAVVA